MAGANNLRILLTSAGAKIPLLHALQHAARRLCPSATVIAGDSTSPCVSEYFADEFWLMPRLTEESAALVIQQLREKRISHILPSRDGELLFWAKRQAQLATVGIQVLISPERAIVHCIDKYEFSQYLVAKGLPVIPSFLQPDQIKEHIVVKERFGAGSTNIGIALTLQQAVAHAKNLHQPIFQPYIAGREISIDAWLDQQSQLKAHVYRYRTKINHGESQISQTAAMPQYDEVIRHSLESLGLTGPVVIQAMVDSEQQLHIIECNSRFGGASTLGIKAGVDSLYWSLAETLGIDIKKLAVNLTNKSITQVRYANDLYL